MTHSNAFPTIERLLLVFVQHERMDEDFENVFWLGVGRVLMTASPRASGARMSIPQSPTLLIDMAVFVDRSQGQGVLDGVCTRCSEPEPDGPEEAQGAQQDRQPPPSPMLNQGSVDIANRRSTMANWCEMAGFPERRLNEKKPNTADALFCGENLQRSSRRADAQRRT